MDEFEANPLTRRGTRRMLASLGLGIGIAGVGATLGDIYRKPEIAVGGLIVGVAAALLHLPWSEWIDNKEQA